jgi:DNA-binding NtrC family response regulator
MQRDSAEVVSQSPTMRAIVNRVTELAAKDAPVLFLGEDGTGKSRLAKLLHARSRRAQGPFVEVSYDPAPTETAKDEIFGEEAEHPGALGGAQGGTMVIDELRSLTLAAQDELIAFLERGEIRGRRADVRVALLCHIPDAQGLGELVSRGLLRARLADPAFLPVVTTPPLRSRKGELPALAKAILEEESEVWTIPDTVGIPEISAAAMEALVRYDWPGNTRELKRELLRAVGRSGGAEIGPQHLSENIAPK